LHVAVVREVLEETGLEVVVDHFLGWVERIGDHPDTYHFVILDFAVTPLDTDATLVPGDDTAEAAWIPLADVADLDLVDGLFEFLHDVGIIATAG
jgi:ADP-ribose pyrophosphatase YjhB (NUDIX family)